MNINDNRGIWSHLVAIEGIDGSGTTTLTNSLKEVLCQRGKRHDVGCEPTNGEIGKLIRKMLSGAEKIHPNALALLFAADRVEHIYAQDGIKNTVENNGIYITDRYFFSSLAYQSLGSDWHWVDRLNSPCPLPGYLIYLSLPVSQAMERLTKRDKREIFENEGFQNRVLKSYETSIDAYKDSGINILRLDALKRPETLLEEALDFLAPILQVSRSLTHNK